MVMNNMRKYISLLLILVVASLVSWWSSKNEARVTQHIEEEVARLVPRFISDPTSLRSFVIDPALEPILATSLQNAVIESSLLNQKIVVIVTFGDNKSFGDGTATHVAMLEVDHKPIAGLRIICESENDPLLISGVFSEYAFGVNSQ